MDGNLSKQSELLGKIEKKILHPHEYAPAHSSLVAQIKLDEMEFKLVTEYSPDLAPTDFYLKRWPTGKRFYSNEGLKLIFRNFWSITIRTVYKS